MKKRIGIMTAALMLVVMLVPGMAFAASSSVSISGGGSTQVGKTVTVTVTYKGSNLGYVNGQMTYDNNKLEYVSGGSSKGDAGLVQLKEYADGNSGKLSFTIKFKAKGAGSVNLNLETLETQNIDGDQSMGTPSASKTVKVAADSNAGENTKATTESKETTQETTIQEENTTPVDEESSSEPADQKRDSGSGMNYWILGGSAVVLILLIAVIAVILYKRKNNKR